MEYAQIRDRTAKLKGHKVMKISKVADIRTYVTVDEMDGLNRHLSGNISFLDVEIKLENGIEAWLTFDTGKLSSVIICTGSSMDFQDFVNHETWSCIHKKTDKNGIPYYELS